MRYIFFGGQESLFAKIILKELTEAGMAPVAVIRDARAPLDLEYLRSLNADFFLVAAFGKILKKELLEIPQKGVLGIHPSLLPKYRGASPIQSVILNDEKETGTAIFQIDEKVDHGAVLSMEKLAIEPTDTYQTLTEKLAYLSANLFIKTAPKWLAGNLSPVIQDESKATLTKKFTGEDAKTDIGPISPIGLINPIGHLSPISPINYHKIWLKIRALNPEPGVFTMLPLNNGKILRLKLLESELRPISPIGLISPISSVELILKKVQPEGKRIMSYKEFLNGYKNLLK